MYGHAVSPCVGFATLIVRLYTKSHVICLRNRCCILRGPDGERIAVVVPEGTELDLRVKTGSWAGRTHSQ